MNRLFVNIKVDREERPDVDQLYMDTVVRLTGHGGWPLTVFCTPEGKPYHAGTYFPPEPRHGLPSFQQVLEAAERVFRTRRDDVEDQASRIMLEWFINEQVEEENLARSLLGRLRLAGDTGPGLLLVDQELGKGELPGIVPSQPQA